MPTQLTRAQFYPPRQDEDIYDLNVRAVWITAGLNPAEIVFSLDGGTGSEHAEFAICRNDAASMAELLRIALGGSEALLPRVALLRAHIFRGDALIEEGICADYVTATPDINPPAISIGLSTTRSDAWWNQGYGLEFDVSPEGAEEMIARLEELARPWQECSC